MASTPLVQQARLLELTTPLGPDALVINGFSGSEALSGLFRFRLDLLAPVKNSVTAKQLLRQPVTVSILSEDKKVRYFHGLVSRFSAADQEERFRHFHAEVVPWIWFLSQRSDCRIFQNKSVPEILKAVFDGAGFQDYQDKTTGDHIPLDYCTQYRETDFNFVSRLMEQDGIFYFFEHESDKHTLIFADDNSAFDDVPGKNEVLYEAEGGMGEREDVITQWSGEGETRPGKYVLRDHNFQLPQKDLEVSLGGGDLEMYDYPGEYAQRFNAPDARLSDVQTEGEKLVRVRLEEEELPGRVFEGSSSCRQFVSGHKFKLDKHFQSRGEYVLTSLTFSVGQNPDYISGRAAAPYHNNFVCVRSDAKMRPRRLTPKPVVSGPQTAVVTVKSGEESFLDKYGRVHVQFFWDRLGQKDEDSSCWVRVSQPWAGTMWGAHFWPRVDQEVVVQFLEGDPDRPLVTGSVYNADNMPPYELPANYTRSGVITRSSKGGGSANFNEIRLEDKMGNEQFFMNAERDMDMRVENDSREYVGKDRHLIVHVDQHELTEGDKHGHVTGSHFEKIEKDMSLQIVGKQMEKVTGNKSMEVTSDHYEKVGGSASLEVAADQKEKVGGNVSLQVSQSRNEKIGMTHAMEAGQTIHLKGGMTVIIEAGMQLSLKGPGGFVDIGPAGVTIQGTMVLINSGGAAGNGPGASPTPPDPPEAPTDPKDPDTADDGSKGTKMN
jgi:type VI secretion system secreted protein VgrG